MNKIKFFIEQQEVSENEFNETGGSAFRVSLANQDHAWIKTLKEAISDSFLERIGLEKLDFDIDCIEEPALFILEQARDQRLYEIVSRIDPTFSGTENPVTTLLMEESTGKVTEIEIDPDQINEHIKDLIQDLEDHGEVKTRALFTDGVYRSVDIYFNENFYATITAYGHLFEAGDPDFGMLDADEGEDVDELTPQETKAGDANETKAEDDSANEVSYTEAGFDLTTIPAKDWTHLIETLKLSAEPALTQSSTESFWSWQGANFNINTTHNPLTGEDSRSTGGKEQADYAGYIGIIGEPDMVKEIVDYIKANGEYANMEDGSSTFITSGTTGDVDAGKSVNKGASKGAQKIALKNDPKYKEWVEQVKNNARQHLGIDKFPVLFSASLPIKYLAGKTAGDVVYKWAKNKELTWLNNLSDDEAMRAMGVKMEKESKTLSVRDILISQLSVLTDGEALIEFCDTGEYHGEVFLEKSFNNETGQQDKETRTFAFCVYRNDKHCVVKTRSLDRVVSFLENRFLEFDEKTGLFMDQVGSTNYRFSVQ